MSAKSEKILRDFTKALTTPKGTSAYDTQATVLRVEGDIAWVHIPGGVDETPVKMTIDAKEGDVVQVRVSGGRAFLVGNATAPPTDDAEALVAKVKAEIADETAKKADTKATEAKDIAEEAGEAVAEVTQHFWTDENGAHITEVTQEEYLEDPSSAGPNTLIDSDGMKVRDGETEKASFGTISRIGEEDKARIEITDESFKQITDDDVIAVNIQSSGSTEESTIIHNRNLMTECKKTTISPNSSTVKYSVGLGNYYDTDSVIGLEYGPIVITYGFASTKAGAKANLQTYTITPSQLEEMTSSTTITLDSWDFGNNAYINIELRLNRYDVEGENYHRFNVSLRVRYITGSASRQFQAMYLYAGTVQAKKKAYIPSIELNGEITFNRPTDVFVIETYEHTYGNLSSGNEMAWNESKTKAGYYPIGVISFRTGRVQVVVNQARIYNRAIGSCDIQMDARALATASGTTASMQVLWVKAE